MVDSLDKSRVADLAVMKVGLKVGLSVAKRVASLASWKVETKAVHWAAQRDETWVVCLVALTADSMVVQWVVRRVAKTGGKRVD